jgi:hypothetical protein
MAIVQTSSGQADQGCGFPHRGDQFISAAATAWGAIELGAASNRSPERIGAGNPNDARREPRGRKRKITASASEGIEPLGGHRGPVTLLGIAGKIRSMPPSGHAHQLHSNADLP